MIAELYTDGGMIGDKLSNASSRSTIGITWAWIAVDEHGTEAARGNGYVLAADVGEESLTNNYAELEAVVRALEAMSDDFRGVVLTDSKVTWGRISQSWKLKEIPVALRVRLYTQRVRFLEVLKHAVLVKGHPNLSQLEHGETHNGIRVSGWNVTCDVLCRQAAAAYWRAKMHPEPHDTRK